MKSLSEPRGGSPSSAPRTKRSWSCSRRRPAQRGRTRRGASLARPGAASRRPQDHDPDQRHADSQADQMTALVRDLLDAGRMETGTLSVKPAPAEVVALVDQARRTFLSAHPAAVLTIDLPSTLPPVLADGGRIRAESEGEGQGTLHLHPSGRAGRRPRRRRRRALLPSAAEPVDRHARAGDVGHAEAGGGATLRVGHPAEPEQPGQAAGRVGTRRPSRRGKPGRDPESSRRIWIRPRRVLRDARLRRSVSPSSRRRSSSHRRSSTLKPGTSPTPRTFASGWADAPWAAARASRRSWTRSGTEAAPRRFPRQRRVRFRLRLAVATAPAGFNPSETGSPSSSPAPCRPRSATGRP